MTPTFLFPRQASFRTTSCKNWLMPIPVILDSRPILARPRGQPTIQTGLIYVRHKNPIDAALNLKAQYLVSLYRFTHAKNIEDAHNHDLKVIVWTINDKEEIKNYKAKGVDGIASDKPDIFEVIS